MAVWQELSGKIKTTIGSALRMTGLQAQGREQRRNATASDAASRARAEEQARKGEARGEAVAAHLIEEDERERARAEQYADKVKSNPAPRQGDVPGTPENPG
jgi:hypothetical protein